MEALIIEQTESTPNVVFDPNNLEFILSGVSRPKNPRNFYKPLLDWLDNFVAQHPSTSTPLSLDTRITEIDSASLKYVSEIFRRIGNIHKTGMRVIIDWYLESEDELMREIAQELSEVSELPFNYIDE